jgi:hypothetical protein
MLMCHIHTLSKNSLLQIVGISAAVATLAGYTSGLFYGFSLLVLYSVPLFGQFTRNYYTHILSIYMGPVARQVDYQATQAIQSIQIVL